MIVGSRRTNKWSRGAGRTDRGALRFQSIQHSEQGPGNYLYQVQRVQGSQKEYMCPGCLHTITPHTPHIVAWPEEAPYGYEIGVNARRHWHIDCWKRKLRPAER